MIYILEMKEINFHSLIKTEILQIELKKQKMKIKNKTAKETKESKRSEKQLK